MSWECFFYWVEHHPGLASWVQAIGSIAAIVAAALIASRQSRRELLRAERADSVALEALIALASRSAHAVKRLYDKQRPNHRSGEDVAYVSACYEAFIKIDILTVSSSAILEQVMLIRSNLEVALQQAELAQSYLDPVSQSKAHALVHAAYIVLEGAKANLELLRGEK